MCLLERAALHFVLMVCCQACNCSFSFVHAGTGAAYTFRFPTRKGYTNTRMPFNAFRPLTPGEPPLDANTLDLAQIAIRFEVGGRYD